MTTTTTLCTVLAFPLNVVGDAKHFISRLAHCRSHHNGKQSTAVGAVNWFPFRLRSDDDAHRQTPRHNNGGLGTDPRWADHSLSAALTIDKRIYIATNELAALHTTCKQRNVDFWKKEINWK